MIDQFTKEDFEFFLENHTPYEPLGLIDGEYCYRLILDGQAAIMLRSSVGISGVAKKSSKDSIRLWLVDNDNRPLGNKLDNWTQRIVGWQIRLANKIYELATRRKMAGDCFECSKPFGVYRNKKSKKLFVKCFPCSERLRRNINGNLRNEGRFSPASQMSAGDKNDKNDKKTVNQSLASNRRQGENTLQPNSRTTHNIANKIQGTNESLQKVPEKNSLDEFLANPFAEAEPEQDIPQFKPSAYQQAIYDFVQNGSGHGVVSGVAGCGKTTTNVEALKLVPYTAKIKYAAFNKHIERDISAKAPKHVSVSTFHSWGLGNIKKGYPKIKINQWKVHNLIDNESRNIDRDFKNEIVKVIGLLKGNLLEPTQANIMKTVISFGLSIKESDFGLIKEVFLASIKDFDEIDFEDMVYYPASGIVACEKFDYIFVDEAQDMNMAQYILSKKSLAVNGRMLLIGDPNQSIYGFRGAHIGIMDFMADEMNATKLPLTISYRAPLSIVNHINIHYGHIKFEASETAKKGHIQQISLDQFYSIVGQNDGVLCRTNAPLVKPCFSLIRRGIKATILGRDIGTGLIKLIEKREKLRKVYNLDDLLEQVDIYCNNESRKALRRKQETRAALLQDQAETIYALSDDCKTIQDLKAKTKDTFSDKKDGTTFSSIHKAKGLEWQRVFVVGPKDSHPLGDEQQETNIRYVRDTRTLNELYFVEE